MQSAFLVHVPKTGGSSVDAILGEEFPAQSTLRGVQHDGPLDPWWQIGDESIRFLSGHIPANAVNLHNFEQRITILRPPEECMASFIGYADRHFPEHNARKNITRVWDRWSLYGSYFSPGFDTLRYVTERRYGIEKDHFFEYADPCAVPEALSTLESFSYVLDFRYLNDEIRRLVIEQGLFPRSVVPNLRSDGYSRDLASIRDLVTPFDIWFYDEARKHFRPIPADIDGDYDRYRRDYCRTRGLRIDKRQSLRLDLSRPLGTGWRGAEVSEKGQHFRWASLPQPQLNIPLTSPGDYRLAIYLKSYKATNLRATVSSLASGVRVEMRPDASPRVQGQGMVVLRAEISIPESDWLDIQFNCDQPTDTASKQDRAAAIFLLGEVQVRRGGR